MGILEGFFGKKENKEGVKNNGGSGIGKKVVLGAAVAGALLSNEVKGQDSPVGPADNGFKNEINVGADTTKASGLAPDTVAFDPSSVPNKNQEEKVLSEHQVGWEYKEEKEKNEDGTYTTRYFKYPITRLNTVKPGGITEDGKRVAMVFSSKPKEPLMGVETTYEEYMDYIKGLQASGDLSIDGKTTRNTRNLEQ